MSRPLVRQTTADDFDQVASRTQALLDEFSIDDTNTIDIEVQPFGSKRWLILVTYFGLYLFRGYMGFGKSVARALTMIRGASPKAGLLLAFTNVVGFKRGLSSTIGVVLDVVRLSGSQRGLSDSVGLATTLEQWSWRYESVLTGLVAATIGRAIEIVRGETPAVGLVCDVGFILTRP